MKTIYVDADGVLAEFLRDGEWMEAGYYATLPVITNMIKAVRIMKKKDMPIKVLTKYPTEQAKLDKAEWFSKHLPEVEIVYVPYTENKGDYVEDEVNSILIDDFNDNLFLWRGLAIKFMNGINGSSGKWQGRTVGYKMNPKKIVRAIEGWM